MITNFIIRIPETPCISVLSLQNFSNHMKKSVILVPSEEWQPLQQAIDLSLSRLAPAPLSQQCNHFITVFTPPVRGVPAVPTSRAPYTGRGCSPQCVQEPGPVLPLPSRRGCSNSLSGRRRLLTAPALPHLVSPQRLTPCSV